MTTSPLQFVPPQDFHTRSRAALADPHLRQSFRGAMTFLQDKRRSQFGSGAAHRLGRGGNRQAIEKRSGKSLLHLSSTMSNDAKPGRDLHQFVSEGWAVPGGDQSIGHG